MRISRFFCEELDFKQNPFTLPDSVFRHAVQVLRLRVGDSLRLFNGEGIECEAVLLNVAKRSAEVHVEQFIETETESPLSITLLQGISRGERMDYAIQKAVELGVTRIIPVVTERCNVQLDNGRAEKRMAHWQGVITSACEQSGRSVLPTLDDVLPLREALLIPDLADGVVLDPLAKVGIGQVPKLEALSLLIGPEGGLTEDEVVLAKQRQFMAVRFGPRILRTETAAAAAIAVLQTQWGDMG
jgi:16S rRNA (uracil1498-N3)-methyltransferase